MADLGRRNQLTILRAARPGVYLDGGIHGEILMPRKYVPEGAAPGDAVEAFVFRDSEDRVVATTEIPRVMVGEIAVLTVSDTHAGIGAFLDWGLTRDLLLPRREQTGPVRRGDRVAVRVYLDERSDRIVASMKIDRWLGKTPPPHRLGDVVQAFVTRETPLGYAAVVDGMHRGLFRHASLSAPLEIGSVHAAHVVAIRPDRNIDLTLDRPGYGRVKPLGETILQSLQQAGGSLSLNDDSSPEDIRAAFGVSKKAFKQALGALYRQHRIAMEEGGIRLVAPARRGQGQSRVRGAQGRR